MHLSAEEKFAKFFFNKKVRIRLYRKLASQLSNGVSLRESFELFYKQASFNGTKPRESVAVIMHDILVNLNNGDKVGKAISKWVSDGETMMIVAGEDAGSLHKMLLQVADNLENKGQMVSCLSGLIYPIFVLSMICGVLAFFSSEIVPQFALIVPPENWEGAGYFMYQVSDIVRNYGFFILISIIAFLVTIIVTLPTWTGKSRLLIDKIPPWSIYRMIKGSDFLTSLNTLLLAGARIEEIIKRLRMQANPYLKERLDSVLYNISNGAKLGTAMELSGHQFPSQEIIDDLVIYERQSDLAQAIGIIAKEWVEEGVKKIKMQVAVMSVVSMVVLGFISATMVLGIFSVSSMMANQSSQYQR